MSESVRSIANLGRVKDIDVVVNYTLRTILHLRRLTTVRSFDWLEKTQSNLHFRSLSHRSPALRPVFEEYKIDGPEFRS